MGKETAISWTRHTFNPWWGCEKVSPACAHCYAETFAKRIGHFTDSPSGKPPLWGAKSERRFFGNKHWNEPLKWNKELSCQCPGCDTVVKPPRGGFPHAPTCGMCNMVATYLRPRVFCASMADVFEDREDLIPHRARLFELIRLTPNLDWLLLTKRPENIMRHVEEASANLLHTRCPYPVKDPKHQPWVQSRYDTAVDLEDWYLEGKPPANVWLGTTVENQEMADKRIPELLKIPAKVRFLSCEPLLGPVDFRNIESLMKSFNSSPYGWHDWLRQRLHWVICGGESGAAARPMHPDWARSLRDQCEAARVPFHFKQWGEWAPEDAIEIDSSPFSQTFRNNSLKHHCMSGPLFRVGTARAGRLLDGVLHDAFPIIKP